jgi:hypothetical protein
MTSRSTWPLLVSMRRTVAASAVLAVLVVSPSSVPATFGPAAADLPERLTGQEFWRLSQAFSERGGTFRSDNFVLNEGQFQRMATDDGSGRQRSYLASERLFGVIRDIQPTNRVVPVVGD